MKNKLIVIFVCTLLTVAIVLQVAGIMNINNTKQANNYIDTDTVLNKGLLNPSENDKPIEPAPMPLCTKKGYLSIPPAAFTPMNNFTYFENKGFVLHGEDEFVAPVYLPNKATVTNITYFWKNEAPASFLLYLYRNHMDGSQDEMALVWVTQSGTGSSWTNTIDYAEIDNSLYSYYITTGIMEDMSCYGVVIEYKFTKDSSSVSMYEEDSIVTSVNVR